MITLRPHQVAAADAVEQAYREGIRRPLVDACVAAGKSLMMAELARRAVARGGRVLIGAHTRELVEQNAKACQALMPGLHVGINAAALNERTWRAPIISCAIQSVFRYAHNFGPITDFLGDEAHLWPHSEAGMYRKLARDLGDVRTPGFTGTVFRMQGGSLVEGEGAPFDKVVFSYSILDGIRDGYLCPAFSLGATEKIDPTRLRTRQGEFTGESSDAQMIAAIDNHIAQMVHHGSERRAWLIFEATAKSAYAMTKRLNEWRIPAGLVLGETPPADRKAAIDAFHAGRLRALVNINALTTGFDEPAVDLLVMRRPTKSLGLYIQQVGRGLRTIGGKIETSIAAGKADCAVLDFAGNIDLHGPLDFIQPRESRSTLVSCEACGTRNGRAAIRCWSCDEPMTKLCPACLESVPKGTMDCPHCEYDMREPDAGGGEERKTKLRDTPSGAALIAAYRTGVERDGGWLPVEKIWETTSAEWKTYWARASGKDYLLYQEVSYEIEPFRSHLSAIRWIRVSQEAVDAVLLPNGGSRSTVRQVTADGLEIVVPMPGARAAA